MLHLVHQVSAGRETAGQQPPKSFYTGSRAAVAARTRIAVTALPLKHLSIFAVR
jgi:hypothetical protein